MSQPYIMTGTVGERWPVKVSNMAAYDVDLDTVGLEPCVISTKDPSDQEFIVAVLIPEGQSAIVIPKWAFGDVIDESQIMVANSPQSIVSHNGGDFIVAKHIEGQPEYMELPDDIRNTKEAAELYDPRIVNGSIMQRTYDYAKTQDEINQKYSKKLIK